MRITFVLLTGCVLLGCGRDAAHRRPPQTVIQNSSTPPAAGPGASATTETRPEISLEGANGVASTTRNLYFVFDGSGSMKDPLKHSRKSKQTKIDGAKAAVDQFMQSLPNDVNLGLFVFDAHGAREVVPLGPNNRQAFLSAIHAVKAKEGTPLGESIITATDALVKQYKQQLGYGEFRIIVVTDGIATGRVTIPDAAQRAAAVGMPIYTIGLDVAEGHDLRNHSVKYYAADSFEELRRGLQEAAAESESFDPQEFTR